MESLFVYKLNVLSCISEEQCKRIEKTVSEFIWLGKKPKITHGVLQLLKHLGGQCLFDIRTKQKALKIQWIKKTKNSHFFTQCLKSNIPMTQYQFFWECNIAKKDVKELCNENTSIFWKEMLEIWCKFNFHDPQNAEGVLHQIIWLNSLIKVQKKIISKEEWLKIGIVRISDICDDENNFLSYEDFTAKCNNNKITWLEYYSIIDAIPQQWKFCLKTSDLIDSYNPKHTLLEGQQKIS